MTGRDSGNTGQRVLCGPQVAPDLLSSFLNSWSIRHWLTWSGVFLESRPGGGWGPLPLPGVGIHQAQALVRLVGWGEVPGTELEQIRQSGARAPEPGEPWWLSALKWAPDAQPGTSAFCHLQAPVWVGGGAAWKGALPTPPLPTRSEKLLHRARPSIEFWDFSGPALNLDIISLGGLQA